MTKKPPVKDIDLWKRVIPGVAPLKGDTRTRVPLKETKKIVSAEIQEKRAREYFTTRTETLDAEPVQVTVQKQIRVTKIVIESRVDLHGMTRQEAMDRLQKFLLKAQANKHLWVLVITGHGDPDNPMTLKKLMPQWLEQLPVVSGYAPAKPKDGGSGAWYVRVKRSV